MPDDDLLRHLVPPTAPSPLWWWLAGAIAALHILWFVGVVHAARPAGEGVDGSGLLGRARDHLLRRRHARAVHAIAERHRRGELTTAQAGAALNAELRRFLRYATGLPAEYLQVDDLARRGIAGTELLEQLGDAQFNTSSTVDVARTGSAIEELITTWT